MNLNQVKRNNLKSYNSFVFTAVVLFIISCSDTNKPTSVYEPSDYVDPNTSLDCSGIWENSPLCLERNEALIELKKLESLFLQINENVSNVQLIDQVKSIRAEGNKFYNDEFYFKARDSYSSASQLIINFQNQNINQLNKFIVDIGILLNLDKISEARLLLNDALALGILNDDLDILVKRIENYDEILNLIKLSNSYLSSQSYDEALKSINKAISLDNNRDDTKKLKATVVKQKNDYYFNLNIKNAYKFLNLSDIKLALKYANDAKKIYPNNDEFLILEKAVLNSKQQLDLSNFIKNAELSYKQEDWNNSIKNYKLALNLSSNDMSIKNQIDKLNQIIDIKSKLDKFINEPDRLSSSNIRRNLQNTINRANDLNLNGETNLISLISESKKLYEQFNTMILLTITSNNETFVDIQKTVQYQPFFQESIKLYPGRYTLIAKKKGKQSYRKDINLSPNIKEVTYIAECGDKCKIYESNNISPNYSSQKINQKQENVTNIQSASRDKDETNSPKYIEGYKINNNLFTRNLVCSRTTKNNSFKVTFEISVNKTGSVIATKVINNTLASLNADDRQVIIIIERALKKSKFKLPRINGVSEGGKIKYPVSVPRNFCEA